MDEQRLLEMFRSILEEKLQESEERMVGRLQESEERTIGIMDTKLQQLETRLTAKVDEVRMDIAAVSARVDLIKEAVDSLEESMTDVKKVLVYLQDKWVEHDREIWQLKRKA